MATQARAELGTAAPARDDRGRAAHRRGRWTVVVVATVLAVSGCGVRLDSPPPPLPTAGPAEAARQAAAQRSERLAALATSVLGGAGEGDAELERVAEQAAEHVVALGGVWVPPDWAEPTGAGEPAGPSEPTDPASAASPDPPTAADVARALLASAESTCGDAITVDPADLATLLASICLAQDRAATSLGEALGDPPGMPGPAEREAALRAAVEAVPETSSLARSLDAAGCALEVEAARSTGPARTELADRARAHRATALLLLETAGTLGTAEDPRRAAYSLDEDASDPAAVETEVLAAWTAVVGSVPAAVRGAALAEMVTAERAAHEWGAPATTFPGLP